MAARYATQSFWYRNSVTTKEEFVSAGALRDSTHQAVVQCPSFFATLPLGPGQIPDYLVNYLAANPAGP